MIAQLLLTFAIFALAFAGLALGVFLGRPPIRGSCGGIACGNCAACPHRHEDKQ